MLWEGYHMQPGGAQEEIEEVQADLRKRDGEAAANEAGTSCQPVVSEPQVADEGEGEVKPSDGVTQDPPKVITLGLVVRPGGVPQPKVWRCVPERYNDVDSDSSVPNFCAGKRPGYEDGATSLDTKVILIALQNKKYFLQPTYETSVKFFLRVLAPSTQTTLVDWSDCLVHSVKPLYAVFQHWSDSFLYFNDRSVFIPNELQCTP
ncbi:hypothetical protein J6590_085931 [Homalodisca vitripennis]|nr:hypothetical protein J6590_085931 [Homalodisca vitripennis]